MHSVRKRLNKFQISSDTQFLRCLEQLHCIQALNLGGDTTPDGLTGSQEASSVLGGCEKVSDSASVCLLSSQHIIYAILLFVALFQHCLGLVGGG